MTFKPNFPGRPPGPPSGPGSGSGPTGPSSGPRPFRSRFPDQRERETFDKNEPRLNERIRVPEVRLIDENGQQVGIVKTFEALKMARERGLDLMEVAPDARPPVCKIADYGKYKYQEKKKEQMARKKQVIMKVKEVQFRPGTDQHDIDYKVRNIVTFLEEGDKAKITIMFRGREITHQENGRKIMDMIIEKTKEIAVIEQFPMMEGRKMIMVLAPGKKKPGGAPQSPASKPDGKPESKP